MTFPNLFSKFTPDDRRLARTGLLTAIVSTTRVAVAFGLSIVLARMLGPADFGTYAVAVSFATILAVPSKLGLPYPVVRETAGNLAQGHNEAARRINIRAHRLVGAVSISLAIVSALAITKVLDLGAYEAPLLLGTALIPLLSLEMMSAATLRGLSRVARSALAAPFLREALLLTALPLLVLVQASRVDNTTALAAHVVAGLLAVTIGYMWVAKYLPRHSATPEAVPAPRMAGAGSFAVLEALDLATGHLDVLLLAILLSPEDVGIYKIAVAVGAAILAIEVTASQVTQPEFAAAHRAGDHRALAHVARRFVQLTSLAGIGILLLLMAFGRTALDFAFGPEYANAFIPILVIASGMALRFMAGPSAHLLNMTGHERSVVFVQIASSMTTTILFLALVPSLGLHGAAIAYALALALPQLILAARARALLDVRTTVLGL